MKKALITLLVVAILASALAFSASAANFEHLADELNALGLFRGTDAGYDLDRAPNRGEGLVMLIRLLGLEEQALACDSETPFSDVPAWLKPYVAYAYENDLTNGTSDTTYSPGSPCSAQMYVTFVLRALGYSDGDGGDFTYAGALDFGKKAGIIDDSLLSGDFLRDQMVAVSYLALIAAPKGGDYDFLINKLIDDGAISRETALKVLAKWPLLSELAALGSGLDGSENMEMKIKIDADLGSLGALLAGMGMGANFSIDMDMSMVMEDDDILAAISMVMDIMGDAREMQMYMADGYAYVDTGDQKIKTDAGLSNISGILAMTDVSQLTSYPLYITEISNDIEGEYTVYSFNFAEGYVNSAMGMASGLIGSLGLDSMGAGDMDITISGIKFYADSDGALSKIAMQFDVSATINMGIPMRMNIKMNMEAEIVATGDSVKVELPGNLDEYEEVDREAALAAAA